MAFEALARRFCDEKLSREKGSGRVNVLGMTPLDFSVNGSDGAIRSWLTKNGFTANSVWAMGSTLDEIIEAGRADVNLVVSCDGLAAAKYLKEKFGTPYVVGVPFGIGFADTLASALSRASVTGKDAVPFAGRPMEWAAEAAIIGESVYSGSLAAALGLESGVSCQVICPLETEAGLLAESDSEALDEDEIVPLLGNSGAIIADPMYRPICPADCRFVPLPSEAFSGRIYRKDIPNLIDRQLKLL
jgi:hypothetical protein